MKIRPARPDDAPGLSAVLQAIIAMTGHDRPASVDYVLDNYIDHPDRIACSVAVEGDGILGFQSLRLARAGNPWQVTPGFGIIGTHIGPAAHRKGAGRALLTQSLAAAREAGIPVIDASIGESNSLGLAYYQAMGFRPYRRLPGVICHRLDLDGGP